MTPTAFAQFKYNHAGSAPRSRGRWWFSAVSLVLALALGLRFHGLAWAALLLPAVVFFGVKKQLLLGPRYVLCGNSIVYFANVAQVVLDRKQGSLQLRSVSGSQLLLERAKFPTGARREPKITQNKQVKFEKVANKILERVRQAAPLAQVTSD